MADRTIRPVTRPRMVAVALALVAGSTMVPAPAQAQSAGVVPADSAVVIVPPVVNDPLSLVPQGSCADLGGTTDHFVGLPTNAGGMNYADGWFNDATWEWLQLRLFRWNGSAYELVRSSNWFVSWGYDGGSGAKWYEYAGGDFTYRGQYWGVDWDDVGAHPGSSPGWYRTAYVTYHVNPSSGGFDFGTYQWVPNAQWSGARWTPNYSACNMT